MLATSSMEVHGWSRRGVSDTVMTGGGGAFAFLRRGVLAGRLGVLVAIEELYIFELDELCSGYLLLQTTID